LPAAAAAAASGSVRWRQMYKSDLRTDAAATAPARAIHLLLSVVVTAADADLGDYYCCCCYTHLTDGFFSKDNLGKPVPER